MGPIKAPGSSPASRPMLIGSKFLQEASIDMDGKKITTRAPVTGQVSRVSKCFPKTHT